MLIIFQRQVPWSLPLKYDKFGKRVGLGVSLILLVKAEAAKKMFSIQWPGGKAFQRIRKAKANNTEILFFKLWDYSSTSKRRTVVSICWVSMCTSHRTLWWSWQLSRGLSLTFPKGTGLKIPKSTALGARRTGKSPSILKLCFTLTNLGYLQWRVDLHLLQWATPDQLYWPNNAFYSELSSH